MALILFLLSTIGMWGENMRYYPELGGLYKYTSRDSIYWHIDWISAKCTVYLPRTGFPFPLGTCHIDTCVLHPEFMNPFPDTLFPVARMIVTDEVKDFPVRMVYWYLPRTYENVRWFLYHFFQYYYMLDYWANWNEFSPIIQYGWPHFYRQYARCFGRPQSAAFEWNYLVWCIEKERFDQ